MSDDPIEDALTDENPADQNPADENPADQNPADQNPADDPLTDDPLTDDPLTDDPRWGDLEADPALASAVIEIERHLAADGWDQPSRLYALVDTTRLAAEEPALAAAMGLDADAEQGSLTAVEQESLDPAVPLEQVLESIVWPPAVAGCAVMVERLVLPPGVDAELPEDPEAAQAFAAEHPDRQEVRMVAGATRTGSTYCALRMRAHDEDTSVVGGLDLVPGLLELVRATLIDDTDPGHPAHPADAADPADPTHPTADPHLHDDKDETP